MKSFMAQLTVLGAVALMSGCNSLGGVPEFKASAIAPATLHPGDTALITIDVKDKNEIIDSIVGVVKEEPSIKLTLQDNGEEGDVKAGDGTWSLAVIVPMEGQPGAYHLTFTAYRSDGVAVPIRDGAGEITALTVDMPLVISYKQ